MNTLAPRAGAEAAPVVPADLADPHRPTVGDLEALPPWSTLSWEERAAYVSRYCG
jgi:hypothetical protein